MSVNPFPSCNTNNPSACAGFNENCFITETGTGNPANYLQFPIGQGIETLPGLITIGDVDVGANIVMTGTAGVNYIEFPDGTRQYTAFTGSTTTPSVFTPDANTLVSPSVYFMNPIVITYPTGTKSFSAYGFSGGGNNATPVIFTPNPAVTGQQLTYAPSATSNSGSGALVSSLPVKTGTTNCCQAVLQPNLTPSNGDPNSASVWMGFVSLNPATVTATLVSSSGSNPANIVSGCQLVISNPSVGCPSSIVLTATVGGNNLIWNYVQGSTSSYYVNVTNLAATVYNSTPNRWRGQVNISGNTLTTVANFFGTLKVGYYVLGTSFAVFVSAQTNSTTFTVKGCYSGFTTSASLSYGYASANGVDCALAVYSSNTTPTSIAYIKGSNAPLNVNPTFGGSITSTNAYPLTQYGSSTAVTQGTNTGIYPTLATITQVKVQNSGAVQIGSLAGSSVITNCASSNQKITTFPAGGQPTVTETLGGLGGFGCIFSSV
jgi:hypothetical protein